MKISPRFIGVAYLLIGALFTYLAIRNAQDGVWRFSTIILMFVATLDFGVALRILFKRRSVNKH